MTVWPWSELELPRRALSALELDHVRPAFRNDADDDVVSITPRDLGRLNFTNACFETLTNDRVDIYIFEFFSFCKKKRDYRSSPKAKVLKPKQSVTNFDTRLFQSTNRSRPFIDKKNTIRLIFPFHTNRTENIYRITKAKKCTDQTQRSLRRGR